MTVTGITPETLSFIRYLIVIYVVGWISGFVGGYSYVRLWLLKK